MPFKLAILFVVMVCLPAALVAPESSHPLAFQAATSVGVGGAQFSSARIGAQGTTSTLTVAIATGTSVPSGATATVEVSESGNLSNVSYIVSPSRSQTVTLAG